jgi:hypothetical protein
MWAEASTILRAVAADFFFNCCCLKIPSDNRIRQVPRCAARLSIGRVLGFLCWKWKPCPRVVFRKSRLVWVLFYIYEKFFACSEFWFASKWGWFLVVSVLRKCFVQGKSPDKLQRLDIQDERVLWYVMNEVAVFYCVVHILWVLIIFVADTWNFNILYKGDGSWFYICGAGINADLNLY